MNTIHIYLLAYLSLLAYLWVSNIVWICRKLNSLPTRVHSDRKMMCAKVLSETFRTLYLTMAGVLFGFKFWTQDTSKHGYYENLARFPCKYYRYVSVSAQVSVIIFIRFLFAKCRLYQTRRMLGQNFGMKSAGFIWFMCCGWCTIIAMTITMVRLKQGSVKSYDVCYVELQSIVEVLWICYSIFSELVMLWLYIHPLWKLDLIHGGGLAQVLEYRNFHREKKESLLKHDAYHGLSLKRNSSMMTTSSNVKLGSAPLLLQSYHQSVQRNLYSGILAVFVSVQFLVVFLAINDRTKVGEWYWLSGMALIHLSLSVFAIYICLTLTCNDWLEAFVPCRRRVINVSTNYSRTYELKDNPSARYDEHCTILEDDRSRDGIQEPIKSVQLSTISSFEVKENV